MTLHRTLLRSGLARHLLTNSTARVVAMVGLALATVLVARVGGPSAVGVYALMRILPGLVGVLCVGGLPGALAYFLAAPRRDTPHLWPSLIAIAVAGAAIGTLAWCLGAPLLRHVFFPGDTVAVVAVAGATVATQLFLTVSKTALQGLEDRRGGDLVIALEEVSFLPCYGLAILGGSHGTLAIVLGLALADLVVGIEGWRRVVRSVRGHDGAGPHRPFRGRPDRRLVRDVVTYGTRGQVGGLVSLLNLRLDFAILGALAGPAVLGTYAVASKYAELLRLPGTALTWVAYPELARSDAVDAAQRARRLLRPALLSVWVAAVPMLFLAGPVVQLLYGGQFGSAVPQARVLLVGMLLGGAAGLASGYLYGRGRPGLNSLGLGIGLALTVILDITLIPQHGAMGAAIASTVAYLVADGSLVLMLLRTSRSDLTVEEPVAAAVEATP